ncbi:hypothetical protein [Rothia dentocariosa]
MVADARRRTQPQHRSRRPDPARRAWPGTAEGGLPVVVMTVRSRASHSKSFGSLIRSYGRGKGLSIAASCNNVPGQRSVPPALRRVASWDHFGSHLGVNRGSFRRRTLSEALRAVRGGGGRRG